MEIQEKKLKRQLIGVDKWVHSKDYNAPKNGHGTLWWYTAVGKTFAGLIISNRLLKKDSSARIVVIVPSSALQKQWRDEIALHVESVNHKNFEVYTIHYLVEHEYSLTCELLIADEIHEYLTPERLKYLDKTRIIYNWILGLTATWIDSQNRQKYLVDICPVIDRITEAEALREGFISKFIEYNLACTLTDKERLEYKNYTERINALMPKFENMLEIAGKCLSGGIHTEDGKRYNGFAMCVGWAKRKGWYPGGDLTNSEYELLNSEWHPQMVMGYAKNLMQFIRERKQILYDAENKIDKALEVIKRFPELKAICFAQSTRFADKLAIAINTFEPNSCVTYHSKIETINRIGLNGKPKRVGKVTLKREAIEAIRTGRARRISTASALDRGFNVEDIRLGISSSGTSNPTQHSQRGGRIKRLEVYAPDVTVIIINLYIPDSKDEHWLRKRQSKSTNIVYWIDSIDQIVYSPIDPEIINANLII